MNLEDHRKCCAVLYDQPAQPIPAFNTTEPNAVTLTFGTLQAVAGHIELAGEGA